MKNRPLNSRGGLVQIVYLTEIQSINDVGMLKFGKATKRIMVDLTLGSEDFAFGILPNLKLRRLGFAIFSLPPAKASKNAQCLPLTFGIFWAVLSSSLMACCFRNSVRHPLSRSLITFLLLARKATMARTTAWCVH